MKKKNKQVESKILDRIGKPVKFTYPADEGNKKGILKDRCVHWSADNNEKVPYWDVVDLIEFPDEKEKEWIRIGYYRKPKDRLVWGSQTTITEPYRIWKELLTKAAREKSWFRKLIKEVCRIL